MRKALFIELNIIVPFAFTYCKRHLTVFTAPKLPKNQESQQMMTDKAPKICILPTFCD